MSTRAVCKNLDSFSSGNLDFTLNALNAALQMSTRAVQKCRLTFHKSGLVMVAYIFVRNGTP